MSGRLRAGSVRLKNAERAAGFDKTLVHFRNTEDAPAISWVAKVRPKCIVC